jgi:hypothetical protein
VAPESSAPFVGRLSQRVLHTLKAAGFLGVVGLLGRVSKRTVFGCGCGFFWKLDNLFLERTRVVCSGCLVAGVGCLVDSFTNFLLTASRSLPSSQIG